jgi:hypothetical protein
MDLTCPGGASSAESAAVTSFGIVDETSDLGCMKRILGFVCVSPVLPFDGGSDANLW